jgi:hypothetical protein
VVSGLINHFVSSQFVTKKDKRNLAPAPTCACSSLLCTVSCRSTVRTATGTLAVGTGVDEVVGSTVGPVVGEGVGACAADGVTKPQGSNIGRPEGFVGRCKGSTYLYTL